ncbi:DUF6087 family protein [Streptomyces sp. PA03-1a]|nr:DUF6087 family protein [Streptomyces sp. PA03-1a]MDX2817890.1 DUF6087 family protein [Streptomyces sp. PA03-5A]
MEDEPLEQWVERREERQARRKGRLRAGTLAAGPPRGAHVDPDAPRLISQWDGYAWQPVAVVSGLAEARALLNAARRGRQAGPSDGGQRAAPPPSAAAADRRKARLRALLDE